MMYKHCELDEAYNENVGDKMKVNKDLIFNRRNIESKKFMRIVASEAQLKGLKKLLDNIVNHRCWAK